jgi:hypothetical protein
VVFIALIPFRQSRQGRQDKGEKERAQIMLELNMYCGLTEMVAVQHVWSCDLLFLERAAVI